jgi:hypothetical protein
MLHEIVLEKNLLQIFARDFALMLNNAYKDFCLAPRKIYHENFNLISLHFPSCQTAF